VISSVRIGIDFSIQIQIQIWIQHLRSKWIRIPDPDPGFFMTERKGQNSKKIHNIFDTNCCKTLIKDFQAQVRTIRTSARWSLVFSTIYLRFFPFICVILKILIRILGGHFNTDPHGSGSDTLVIRVAHLAGKTRDAGAGCSYRRGWGPARPLSSCSGRYARGVGTRLSGGHVNGGRGRGWRHRGPRSGHRRRPTARPSDWKGKSYEINIKYLFFFILKDI